MIPAIQEYNSVTQQNRLASYATLHQATVSLQEMGERTISTQVRIDGSVVPDFNGWELRFKGERFVLNTKDPQAMKDNTTRNSLVDLTFTSWVINELKRYYMFEPASVDAGTVMADKYKAQVGLNVEDFAVFFNKILNYYFGSKVVFSLYLPGTGRYSTDRVYVDLNYTYIWDVLTKFYELYGVRWTIDYNSTTDVYTIKAGYQAPSISDHDFEYGYQGGLLKFERQVQDVDIRNILLGRGGEKNLPYRYFKLSEGFDGEVPASQASIDAHRYWAGDPDAIPELANITFDRLRDVNFRWYVRGWMHNPNRDTSGDEAWDPGHVFPTYSIDSSSPYYWAYQKGLTDETFNPVEYVKDDASIAEYGERWGAVEDNDDIFPTIQGISRDPIGRIDETVAVSEIVTDDIEEMAKNAAIETSLNPLVVSTKSNQTQFTLESEEFTIPVGSTGNIRAVPTSNETVAASGLNYVDTTQTTMVVVDSAGTEYPISGIAAGTYRLKISLVLHIGAPSGKANGTFGYESIKLTTSDIDADAWKPTFDIWVKNIWNTSKNSGESDVQYSNRVWGPILGDRAGNEAKVVFSTGFMSISEDYEFVIIGYPVRDTSKTILVDGVEIQSEWRITLRKSDAEYDATGLYIPNATTGGAPIAGDKFFFTGIDMPQMYVEEAEKSLNTNKAAALDTTASVSPTWIINLDKVRCNTLEAGEYGQTLAERLAPGTEVWITDPRFTPGTRLMLYVNSMTYTWNEPSDDALYLVPDIEVVLSDKVMATESTLGKIQNDISMVKEQYARISDVEKAVVSVAGPMFLKKTGESDTSDSPTQFASKVTSKGFRQGAVGGRGWGLYRDNTDAMAEGDEDAEGDSVLEVDKMIVRKTMQVNSLVVNQVDYRGGMEIISAAKIEVSKVIETASRYICYFDQRQNSVANNFVVGDVAFGQVFTPQNSSLRYYKCRVEAVDVDRIELSKTVKDGAGVPQAGDVVVQYGNYSNEARQYVIVRDVVGGGFERMISDLDSVSASGEEYYFAGRQSGQNPRWFVGDAAGEYAEWKNGILNIKGRLTVLNDQGAYQSLSAYMGTVNQTLINQQAQIDGQTQSWASGEAPAAQTKPYPLWDEQTQQVIGTPNFPYTQWADNTERAKHVGDTYVDDSTGQSYRLTKKTSGGTTVYYWTRITDEEVSQAISLAEGLQYLKAATNEGTLVDGGLVLTSMIQLGYTPQGGSYTVMSGINGKPNTQLQDPAKSIAAWFGGPMVDHETYPAVLDYAKSLFRMDGSGYLASGKISWAANGAGSIPGVSWSANGSSIIIDGSVKLSSASGDTVTELLSAVQSFPSVYLSKTDAATLYHPKGGDTTSNTFNIGGATFTWHPAVGTTPGYLELNSAFLTSGDQIVGSGTPGGGGGGASFLYELGDVYSVNNSVARADGTAKQTGDVLQYYDSTKGWVAAPASAGTVTSVAGVSPVNGDIPMASLQTAIGLDNYQPLDADLTAIAGLSGTIGLLKKTAANTWTLDTTTYVPTSRTVNSKALSSNITLSLDDVADGSTRKLADYLPLSAGSSYPLTGALTINAPGNEPLVLNNKASGGTATFARYKLAGSIVATIGYDTTGTFLKNNSVAGTPYVNIASDGVFKYNNSNVFWHDGNDGTGSGLDADLLDGLDSASYLPVRAYDYTNGFLVRTRLSSGGSNQVTVFVRGYPYSGDTYNNINTQIGVYKSTPTGTVDTDPLLGPRIAHYGQPILNVKAFFYNGRLYFWFQQPKRYTSVYVDVRYHNGDGNCAESITNEAMPTTGVTRLTTFSTGIVTYNSLNSNTTSVPWSAQSLTLAGAITGATTISASGLATVGSLKIGDATITWVANSGNGYLKIDKPLLTEGDQIVGSGTPGGGGTGGANYLYELVDVYSNGLKQAVLRADNTPKANGDVLTYNSTKDKWVAAPTQSPLTAGTGITISNNVISVTANTYLPLSGGTLSSSLIYSLSLNNEASGATQVGIRFQINSTEKGLLYVDSSNRLLFYDETNAGIVYHSRNFIAGTNYVAPATLADYLPLAGGTMTGALTMNFPGFYGLYLNNNASGGTASGIRFQVGGTTQGAIYVDTNHNLYFHNNTSFYTVWHSGNASISNSALTLGTDTVGSSAAPIGYATQATRLKRYAGTAAAGGYDLNTMLSGGGITSQYNSGTYWANGPTGMRYGGVAQFNTQSTDTLSLQLAWDVVHDSTAPDTGNIWFRDKTGINSGTWGGWKKLWHDGNSNKSDVPWTCSTLTASEIEIGHDNEINGISAGAYTQNVHLNYRSTGNVTLAYGGGNVGIGTNSPSYKLDLVAGVARSSYMHFYHSGNSENGGYVGCGSSANVVILQANSGYGLRFYTNGTLVGNWNTSGNLTIGATDLASTTSKLYVDGVTTVAGNILPSAAATYTLGSSTTTWHSLFLSSHISFPASSWGYMYNQTKNGGLRFYTTTNDDTPATQEVLRLNPNRSAQFYSGLTVTGNNIVGGYYYSLRADNRFYMQDTLGTDGAAVDRIVIRYYNSSGSQYLLFGNGIATVAETAVYGKNIKLFPNNTSATHHDFTSSGASIMGTLTATGNVYAPNLYLSRSAATTNGRISFYSSSYYTWFEYMTNIAASPTGANEVAGSVVTTWARRSLIENTAGYGWVWESCKNQANATPVIQMELSAATGVLATRGDQVVSSDINLKTNLQDVKYTIEDIAKTRAVTFDWKDGRGHSAGSIAQDWKPLIPELVHGEEGNMTLAYGQIALVNSILLAKHETKQDKEIAKLKARVRDLEKQLQMRN